MKRSLLLLAAVSLFGTALTAGDAAAPQKAPAFTELRNASTPKDKQDSIQSTRIIYSVSGDHESSFIMLRAKKYDKVRLDCVNGKEHYCVVRNGDSFWWHDKKNGTVAMNEDEAASFAEYIAFLDIPFSKDRILSEPVYKGEEEVNKVKRSCYEVKTLNGSGNVYTLCVENKSRLLRKLVETDVNGKTGITMYRDFRDCNGIKLPGSICVAGIYGSYTLKVIKADWNLELDEKIFDKNAKVVDPELDQMLKAPLSEEIQQADAKKKRDQHRVEQLEKKIRKLKLEIADCEQGLQKMESLFAGDRASSESLAAVTSNSGGTRYWGWGYRGHVRTRGSSRESLTRRQIIASREKEAKKVSNEYRRVNNTLLQLRIQLGDAEAELKKLTAGTAE